MKTKNLTLQDVTKDELINYFFTPSGLGGGFDIPAQVDQFLVWVGRIRREKLNGAYNEATTSAIEALKKYVELTKQSLDEKDINKSLALMNKADKYYAIWEKAMKKGQKFEKQMEESW